MNEKSGHWTNTGMAKFINDNLYNYKSDDEKSMNPFRWYRLQNGDDVSKYRETINGFPCRLILINDGSTPLNEGQNEPTPGNTKDMGIFNFNHDKDATKTLGFDSDIFPNCASYEVTANSDTSAGAFMSYSGSGSYEDELTYLKESFELRHPDEDDVAENWGFMGIEKEALKIDEFLYYGNVKTSNMEANYFNSDSITITFDNNASFSFNPTGTNVSPQYGVRSGTTISLEGVDRFYLGAKGWTYVDINENRYYKGITREEGVPTKDENPYKSTIFDTSYGLKGLIDWVDNCTDEEFVRDFEQHFHKDYTLRYYALVTLIGAVDNLG